MKTALIRIGNSQGIRIPKPICEQCGLEGDLEVDVRDGEIVIRSARRPRDGWDGAFARMAENGDDNLLVAESTTEWDGEEWEWWSAGLTHFRKRSDEPTSIRAGTART